MGEWRAKIALASSRPPEASVEGVEVARSHRKSSRRNSRKNGRCPPPAASLFPRCGKRQLVLKGRCWPKNVIAVWFRLHAGGPGRVGSGVEPEPRPERRLQRGRARRAGGSRPRAPTTRRSSPSEPARAPARQIRWTERSSGAAGKRPCSQPPETPPPPPHLVESGEGGR